MRERVQFSPEMAAAGIDPISFEVIRGALQAVCNQIGVSLPRARYRW